MLANMGVLTSNIFPKVEITMDALFSLVADLCKRFGCELKLF